MGSIQFGTDGWRAVIAGDFTFANVDRVTQAAADTWKAEPPPGSDAAVVVGYDRRFLSDQFARRAAEVLAGNGFRVTLTPVPTPTPAVSLAVKAGRAAGGVMITASHNPAVFNGFKLKSHHGGSAEPAFCRAVEGRLDRSPVRAVPLEAAIDAGRVILCDLRPGHHAAIRRLVNLPRIARCRLRVAHDALFGVGAGCFEELLAGTRCRVTTLNGAHDPFFGGINPEPIPRNYRLAAAWLRRHRQDICLVTDGDADRVGGMDGRGNPLSTHQLICLLLRHFIVHRKGRGRVVKALTTTSMVDKMCAASGLDMVETAVGFKYIAAEMLKGNVLLGFEESGGIGFPGHIPERDGILAGLMLIEMLATEGKPVGRLIADLEREYGPHRYARVDTAFPLEQRPALMERCRDRPPARLLRSPVRQVQAFDGVKYIAADGSWLMLRGSGTEPILRIYAEGPSDAAAAALVRQGIRMTREFS